jgi:predicted NBD/HSP70 family sugar kinase
MPGKEARNEFDTAARDYALAIGLSVAMLAPGLLVAGGAWASRSFVPLPGDGTSGCVRQGLTKRMPAM